MIKIENYVLARYGTKKLLKHIINYMNYVKTWDQAELNENKTDIYLEQCQYITKYFKNLNIERYGDTFLDVTIFMDHFKLQCKIIHGNDNKSNKMAVYSDKIEMLLKIISKYFIIKNNNEWIVK